MNKQSKVLLVILIICTVISAGFTFYKTVIKGDFQIISDDSNNNFDEGISNDISNNIN